MKKIRAGVIGVGHLGRFHAQKYAMLPDVELVGVADASVERAALVAAEVKTRPFSSYKELFGLVDVVSIATPTAFHAPIGLEFLSRGIDALIEKPLAMTSVDALRLTQEAARTGAVLQAGHLERFNPAVMALRAMKLAPNFIECSRLSPFPNRSTDIDVVFDMMIHDIDIILSLADSPVEAVSAAGSSAVTDKTDAASALITFKSGFGASITASRVSKERLRKLTLYHGRGFVTADYANQSVIVSCASRQPGAGFASFTEDEVPLEKKDTLLEEIKAFLKCSGEKTAPLVSGAEGKAALEVAEMIQASIARSSIGRS